MTFDLATRMSTKADTRARSRMMVMSVIMRSPIFRHEWQN